MGGGGCGQAGGGGSGFLKYIDQQFNRNRSDPTHVRQVVGSGSDPWLGSPQRASKITIGSEETIALPGQDGHGGYPGKC